MHTGKQKQMNASYQASLVNRHIRRFTGFRSDGRVWKCSAKLAILTQPFNIIQCNIYQNVANLPYIAFIVSLYLKSLYWSIYKPLKNIIFSWYFEKLRKIRLSMSSWFFTEVTRNWLSQDPAIWKSLFYFSTFG